MSMFKLFGKYLLKRVDKNLVEGRDDFFLIWDKSWDKNCIIVLCFYFKFVIK